VYPSTPGIWTDQQQQVEGWKRLTSAVHEKGASIVYQLWHTGRVAHPDFGRHPCNNDGKYQPCVSASAVPIVNRHGKPAKTLTHEGIVKSHAIPRPLYSKEAITRLCNDYKWATHMAKNTGFDGVELHAAHGYLIDQFLNNGTNQNTPMSMVALWKIAAGY